MAYLTVNIPHIDVYVKKEFLYDNEKGHGELTEGVWVTAKSIQGRALYLKLIYQSMVLCMTSYLLVRLYGKKIMVKVYL